MPDGARLPWTQALATLTESEGRLLDTEGDGLGGGISAVGG
jgi:hypothetical protein